MVELYRQRVLKYYADFKLSGNCPVALIMPKCAQLRDLSKEILLSRHKKEDERILKDFFGEYDNLSDLLVRVNSFPVEKFKPVINFLKNKVQSPNVKYVNLAAWLIDYKERPFNYQHYENGNENEILKIDELNGNDATSNGGNVTMIGYKRRSFFMGIGVVAILAILALVNNKKVKSGLLSPMSALSTGRAGSNCMYWNDFKFIEIDCQETPLNKIVRGTDKSLLINFKKITRTDTLTEDHEDKVWYSKINNRVEFFTMPGTHPEKLDRHLKPATKYILKKYAGK